MDLGTINKKLKNQHYYSAKECIDDINTMLQDDYDQEKRKMAKALKKSFLKLLKRLPDEANDSPLPISKRKGTIKKSSIDVYNEYFTKHYEENNNKPKPFYVYICHCGVKLVDWKMLCDHFEKSHFELLPDDGIIAKICSQKTNADHRKRKGWNCSLCNASFSADYASTKNKMHILALHRKWLKKNTKTSGAENYGK